MIDTQLIRPGSVNVLIGPNGSGKSRMLRKLCTSFLSRGDEVIAIAPTIYDRFRRMPKRGLRFFGARQGMSAAVNVVRSALVNANTQAKGQQVLKNLTQALGYTGFDPVIGIKLKKLNLDNLSIFDLRVPAAASPEFETVESALRKWQKTYGLDGVAKITMNTHSFSEFDALSSAILVEYEQELKKSMVISGIDYFLYRKGEAIPLMEACSGEICFITTIAFISTQIERRSVIAIDEPDTSLHPTWQQNYVRTLLDLFHRFEPRILISTHSPIIISGAEVASGTLTVHEVADGQTRVFDHAKLSLEEMYDRLFGLITPRNHYLSQRAVSLLNSLNSRDRNLNEVLHELNELRRKSYDESQQAVITRFEDMARRLDVMRQERHT